MVGESYSAGVLRHQVGYGPTLKKVPNPFLLQVKAFSGVGPVEALVQEQFDFDPIGSYYSGFYASDTQLGARPEATALVPPLSAPATGWNAASKLSGCAAIALNSKFDKEGKVFASGQPLHGAIWRGEKVYDPRKDSTYPGGSGAHRIGVETTYEYSASPALHAGTYAYGRYQNGKKVFGIGLSQEGIDWAALVDWANDCDTNDWTAHGTLWEGGKGNDVQAQRVQNLDDLCAAGGGRWLTAGALLSFDWHRPRVSLATITDDDLLEEGGSITAIQTVRDRMNGVIAEYISPAHNWEQIAADEIIGSTYRTEDGRPLTKTWPLNLVKDATQAGQLGTYAMADSREIGPIELNLKSKWRFYKPGETLTFDSEIFGFNSQVVILERGLDPGTFNVKLTFKGETPAKHPYALGEVAMPPPTPIIGQTQEERDGVNASTVLNQDAVRISTGTDILINADANSVTTTPLPVTQQIDLTQGATNKNADATWSIVSVGGGLAATVNSTGLVSLNTANASGSILVRAAFEGVDYETAIQVNRTRSTGASGGGAGSSSFTDDEWGNAATTGFNPVTDPGAIVQSNGSGVIRLTASSSYYGETVATIKAQQSIDNVTWTDVVTSTDGTAQTGRFPGFVSLSGDATGLTASTDYYVRLVAKVDDVGLEAAWLNPSFVARQP